MLTLCGGQFPARENGDANHAENASHKQTDLSKGAAQLPPSDASTQAERVNRREALHQINYFQQQAEDWNDQMIEQWRAYDVSRLPDAFRERDVLRAR